MNDCHLIRPSNYEKLSVLGVGSLGKAYKVRNKQTQRLYVIKFTTPSQSIINLEASIELFFTISHSTLLPIAGYAMPEKKHPFAIVSPYVATGSLFEAMSKEMLSNEMKMKILFGVAEGMRHLQSLGYSHRHLTLKNILLNDKFEPIISDFWLDLFYPNESSELTALFGYGTLMYSVLTGKIMVETEAPELSSDIPVAFQTIISRCCSKALMGQITFESIVLEFLSSDDILLPLSNDELNRFRRYQGEVLHPTFSVEVLFWILDELDEIKTFRSGLVTLINELSDKMTVIERNRPFQKMDHKVGREETARRSLSNLEEFANFSGISDDDALISLTNVTSGRLQGRRASDPEEHPRPYLKPTTCAASEIVLKGRSPQSLSTLKTENESQPSSPESNSVTRLQSISKDDPHLNHRTRLKPIPEDDPETSLTSTREEFPHVRLKSIPDDNPLSSTKGISLASEDSHVPVFIPPISLKSSRDEMVQSRCPSIPDVAQHARRPSVPDSLPRNRFKLISEDNREIGHTWSNPLIVTLESSRSVTDGKHHQVPSLRLSANTPESTVSDGRRNSIQGLTGVFKSTCPEIRRSSARRDSTVMTSVENNYDSEHIHPQLQDQPEEPIEIPNTGSYPYLSEPFAGIFAQLQKKFHGNPVALGMIQITGNSLSKTGHLDLQRLIDYHWDGCWVSCNEPNSWIQIDFGSRVMLVTHYSLRTYHCAKGYSHLKSWVIEGSNDSRVFTLDVRNDTKELNGRWNFATFIIATPIPCKMIRIRLTGPTHHGDYYLILRSIELFGEIIAT